MIQPLRSIHRRAFVALAIVLPAILVVGLVARRPSLAAGVKTAEGTAPSQFLMESSNLWQKHSIQSRFYSGPDRPQDIYVVLLPAQDLTEPDLLLYWATNAPHGNVVPGEAKLEGAFRTGKAFLLPIEKRAGYLVLFSPAHQTVFDTARLEKLP